METGVTAGFDGASSASSASVLLAPTAAPASGARATRTPRSLECVAATSSAAITWSARATAHLRQPGHPHRPRGHTSPPAPARTHTHGQPSAPSWVEGVAGSRIQAGPRGRLSVIDRIFPAHTSPPLLAEHPCRGPEKTSHLLLPGRTPAAEWVCYVQASRGAAARAGRRGHSSMPDKK